MEEYEKNILDDYTSEEVSFEEINEEEIAFNLTLDKEKLDRIISFIDANFYDSKSRKTELLNFKNLINFIKANNYKISILESEKILDNCSRLEETLDLICDKVDNMTDTSIQSLLSAYSSKKFEKELESENVIPFELNDAALFNDRYKEHGIDLLKLYFNEISQYKQLTPEEEKSLAYKAQAGDKKSYDSLVNSNLKLAAHYAKSYRYSGVAFFDLIQAGNEGLLKAASRFDPSKGFKFSTYATWWIKQSIQRSIADTGRTIRIPVHQYDAIFKIKREMAVYMSENNGEAPSNEYLASILDLPLEKVEFCRVLMNDITSLSSPVGEEGDSELGDFIEDTRNNVDDTLNSLFESQFREAFENTSCLTDREKEILKCRNGFYNNHIYTLEEVGKKLNLTRERIRQIEAKALRKLARNVDIKRYAPEGYKTPVQQTKVHTDTDYRYINERNIHELDKYNVACGLPMFSLRGHDTMCLKLK